MNETRQLELLTLCDRLYDFIPDECWMTERSLGEKLNVSMRQIKYAKRHLEADGRIIIKRIPQRGRSNPKHSLIKIIPACRQPAITQSIAAWPELSVAWEIFEPLTAAKMNNMLVEKQLDVYEEMGIPIIPLHYPRFNKKNGGLYCSCRQNCGHTGKHPATKWKELDFSSASTFRQMKQFWLNKDLNYNIGLLTRSFSVIDIDRRHGGFTSLKKLEKKYGNLPRGWVAETGNGLHIYVANRIKGSLKNLGYEGIDIISNGSFIVAALFTTPHKAKV